jgi:cytochrome c biogenesis protein CcmG, thiol:disulfide interchange protein DsbE
MLKTRIRNSVATAAFLALAAISGAAQDQNPPVSQPAAPDAKAILKQVSETYNNLRSYHFEGRYTLEQVTESIGLKDELKREELFVNAAVKPDRSRIESKNTHLSVTSVYDGKTKWMYTPGPNEYTKTAEGPVKLVPVTPAGNDSPAMAHLANATNLLTRYSTVADRLGDAKIIGEETLEIGAQRSDCFVIEAYYFPASTRNQSNTTKRKLWIDKSRNIVLREINNIETSMQWGRTITSKITYSFTVARVGEQIPESLFAFVPPQGAKEVAELTSPQPSVPTRSAASPRPAPAPVNLAGRDAIAFALKDLDGTPVDLQTLKGKVVLLDFWASWCGPCVAELPHIEKLHKDFKDKGLVVLGVNNEDAEIAREYVKKKGYTFTTLVDEEREVTRKYGVSGIPQVYIIDREGKIKWGQRGYGSGMEARLRNAVESVLKGAEPSANVMPIRSASVSPEGPERSEGMAATSTNALVSRSIKRVFPKYTPEARAAGAQGTVQVHVTVSESGRVIDAKAISGHPLLRDPAIQAAKQWEFKPPEDLGDPAQTQGILVFSFALQRY